MDSRMLLQGAYGASKTRVCEPNVQYHVRLAQSAVQWVCTLLSQSGWEFQN